MSLILRKCNCIFTVRVGYRRAYAHVIPEGKLPKSEVSVHTVAVLSVQPSHLYLSRYPSPLYPEHTYARTHLLLQGNRAMQRVFFIHAMLSFRGCYLLQAPELRPRP